MITNYHDEVIVKTETIKKLQLQIKIKDKENASLQKENARLIKEINDNNAKINTLRETVNSLTAEKSKYLRKIKRLECKG